MNELRKAFQFFFEHAGYCVGERAKGALALARAELEAYSSEPTYGSLTASWHGDDFGDVGDHEEWCNAARRGDCNGHETLYCKVTYFNPQTRRVETLASLGGIVDPDSNYQRVIEAELFAEALALLDQRYAGARHRHGKGDQADPSEGAEMSKHTPGPWKHGDLSGEILAGAQTVASMPEVDGRDEEWEEVCANARLIAAAPDLLEALQFIVNDTPAPGEDAELTVEGYNRACAAIARAVGE